jgi:hypothetical protein
MDLLTPEQKAFCTQMLDDTFDTFSRTIYIWKTANTIVVSADENQYNFIYGNSQNSVVTQEVPVSGQFQGSINWGQQEDSNEKDIRPNIYGNLCQLDLRQDGYNFLSGYNQIIVDGISCSISPDYPGVRPHGIFEINYYNILLRRNN